MLLDDRTVHDNVALPAIAAGLPLGEARARAAAALQRVGLGGWAADARPRELSAGEQQRAALARALVNRPALLLVDEPTAYLDRASASDLLRLLEQFVVAGVTLMMASHDENALRPARARVIALESKATAR
jgi:ABC-type ATPase involved in cell division